KNVKEKYLDKHVKSLDLIIRLGGQVLKRKELLDLVSLSNQTFNFQNVISPLLKNGQIARVRLHTNIEYLVHHRFCCYGYFVLTFTHNFPVFIISFCYHNL